MVRIFFRLGLSMGFSELELLGQIASFERRLREPAQTPRALPYLIRSAPGRDRVCGLSETSEKCSNFCILGGIRPSYSWILAYAELERKKHMGKKKFHVSIISKLASYFVPHNTFFMATPSSKRLAYCRTTAVLLRFDIRFHGQIPLFERCLREGPFPTQRHHCTQCLC